jgi:hypothetical protein
MDDEGNVVRLTPRQRVRRSAPITPAQSMDEMSLLLEELLKDLVDHCGSTEAALAVVKSMVEK